MGLQEQLNQYANESSTAAIDIENAIKKAYEGPTKALIEEGNAMRPGAYNSFFNAFSKLGTGAGDMSPAAALAAAIGEGERGMSRLNNNRGLREYYGTLANDMVSKGLNAFNMGYQAKKDARADELQVQQMDWQQRLAQMEMDLKRSSLEWEKQNAAANRALQKSLADSQSASLQQYYNSLDNEAKNAERGKLNSGGAVSQALARLL